MTHRGWIVLASVVAIVLAIVLTPFAFDYAVGAWTRHEILRIAKEPPNYEVLPTDNALTALTKRASQAKHDRDYQRAVDLYTQGIDDGSYDAKTRRNLIRQRAFAYEDLHQYDRAEVDYNAALAIEPLDPTSTPSAASTSSGAGATTRRWRISARAANSSRATAAFPTAKARLTESSASTTRRSNATPRRSGVMPP